MDETFIRDFFRMPRRATSGSIKKIDDLGLRGPINGMGEADLRGEYYRIALTFEDDELVRGRLTLPQLRALRDELDHFITKAS